MARPLHLSRLRYKFNSGFASTGEIKMKGTFFRSLLFLFLTGMCASVTFAADTASKGSSSLLLTLFLGFFALIVVFQLVPAALLFCGMVKGLFSRQKEEKSFNLKN
jgi:small-conductance mechanosensitive channel